MSHVAAGWSALNDFLTNLASPLTSAYLQKDRALHARAALAVHNHDHATAIPILRHHCFPTYGSLRADLIKLWHEAQAQKAVEDKGGVALTTAERLALRRRLRCDGDHTDRTLSDPCVCGPPNLGYAY